MPTPITTFSDETCGREVCCTKAIIAQIKRGAALAFFASAYAEQADECGQPLSGEIMDQLPDVIDPAADHAAYVLIGDMQLYSRDGVRPDGIAHIYNRAGELIELHGGGDHQLTPELFGHYCAMQAMGRGVGLSDAFGDAIYRGVHVPYIEFGSQSLQRDYFESSHEVPQ